MVLGLETSGQCGSVAVLSNGRVIGYAEHNEPNAHAEQLLPLIESAIQIAGCSRSDITRIAVGTGPGNFTGLRVGISLGYGLAIGLNIPIVGICSLAAMALAVSTSNCRIKLIIRDARKGEVFFAAFDQNNTVLLEPCLIKQIDIDERIISLVGNCARTGEAWTLAGDGLRGLNLDHLIRNGARITHNADALQPDAKHIAYLGELSEASDWPTPEYIREVDAVLPMLRKNPDIELQPLIRNQEPIN